MIQENDIEEIVSFSVVLITAFGSSILGNLFVGKTVNFSSRIRSAYITSYILQVIAIIVMDNLYYHDLEGFVGFMAILIVPALIAVIPALVTSTVCVIIVASQKA